MPQQQPKLASAGRRGKRPVRFHSAVDEAAEQTYKAERSSKRVWVAKGATEGVPAPEEDTALDDASTEAGECTPQASCSGTPSSTHGAAPAAGSRSPTRPSPAKRPLVENNPAEQQPAGTPRAEDSTATNDAGPVSEARVRFDVQEEPRLCDPKLVEQGLARLLSQMAGMAPAGTTRKSPFECKFPPGISIQDYVTRVLRFSQCHASCAVVSLVYLDRLIKRRPWIQVSPLTCHRLLLTSVVIAVKFYDDTYYSNAFYGKVGGLALKELNALEKTYLQLIDYKLFVDPQEFQMYTGIILKAMQLESKEKGARATEGA